MATESGQRIGRYEIVSRIGKGGMAEIFVAKLVGALGFEKQLVIKRILPQYAADRSFVTMFVNEAKLVCQLAHPNIVQVFEFGEADGVYFIAMEQVDGIDGHQLWKTLALRHARLPAPLALYIVGEVLKGLEYAHRAMGPDGKLLGVVHRDVSPSNVLISWRGDVKISDFGIALVCQESRSQAGLLKGKFGYMTPEQLAGLPVDHRSDMFSTGTVLGELLTGARLFAASTDFETMRNVLEVTSGVLEEHAPSLDPDAVELVRRALQRDPADRYQSAGEFQQAIDEHLFRLGHRLTSESLAAFLAEHIAPHLPPPGEPLPATPSAEVVTASPPPTPSGAECPTPGELPVGADLGDDVTTSPGQRRDTAVEQLREVRSGAALEDHATQPSRHSDDEATLQGDDGGPTIGPEDLVEEPGEGTDEHLCPAPDAVREVALPPERPVEVTPPLGVDSPPLERTPPPIVDGPLRPEELTPPLGIDNPPPRHEPRPADGGSVEIDLVDLDSVTQRPRDERQLATGGGLGKRPSWIVDGRTLDKPQSFIVGVDGQLSFDDETTDVPLELDRRPLEVRLRSEPAADAKQRTAQKDESAPEPRRRRRSGLPAAPSSARGPRSGAHGVAAGASSFAASAEQRVPAPDPSRATVRADLQSISVSRCLARLARAGETGLAVLSGPAVAGKHREILDRVEQLRAQAGAPRPPRLAEQRACSVHFERGNPNLVAADRTEDALVAYLVRSGVVSESQLALAIRTHPQLQPVEALITCGQLAPLQVSRQVASFVSWSLFQTFAWSQGQLSYYRGQACPPGAFPTGYLGPELIGKGVSYLPEAHFDSYFVPLARASVVAVLPPPLQPAQFESTPLAVELYHELVSPRPVPELLVGDKRETLRRKRALYLLLECELVAIRA